VAGLASSILGCPAVSNLCSSQSFIVETYYCLWQAVGDDLMFEVEVIDPKDNQRDVKQEER